MKKFIAIALLLLMITCSCCLLTSCGEPQLELHPYSVNFVTNGGSEVSQKNIPVIENSPTTTKENYIFQGWYFDKDFTTPVAFPLSVDCNLTLYAKWKQSLKSLSKEWSTYVLGLNGSKLQFTDGIEDSTQYLMKKGSIDALNYYKWEYVNVYTDTYTKNKCQETIKFDIEFDYGNFASTKGSVFYWFLVEDNAKNCIGSVKVEYDILFLEKYENSYLLNGQFHSLEIFEKTVKTEDDIIQRLYWGIDTLILDLKVAIINSDIGRDHQNTLFNY